MSDPSLNFKTGWLTLVGLSVLCGMLSYWFTANRDYIYPVILADLLKLPKPFQDLRFYVGFVWGAIFLGTLGAIIPCLALLAWKQKSETALLSRLKRKARRLVERKVIS